MLYDNEQVQALAYYDDVRLKSEKAGIYIITYQLPQAPAHGEFTLNWLSFYPDNIATIASCIQRCNDTQKIDVHCSYIIYACFQTCYLCQEGFVFVAVCSLVCLLPVLFRKIRI